MDWMKRCVEARFFFVNAILLILQIPLSSQRILLRVVVLNQRASRLCVGH